MLRAGYVTNRLEQHRNRLCFIQVSGKEDELIDEESERVMTANKALLANQGF